MGADTAFSQVSASAPGYVAASWISGGAMLGYSEIGRDSIDTSPTSLMRIAMPLATLGRLMKQRAIACELEDARGRATPAAFRRRWRHRASGAPSRRCEPSAGPRPRPAHRA